MVSIQPGHAHRFQEFVINVAGGRHRFVRQEDLLYAADDEVGLNSADLVFLLEGESDADFALRYVGCFTVFAVLRGEAGGGEFAFFVRVVRGGLVGLLQKIRMQGVDGKPLVCLDVVVGMARDRQGAHDEAQQRGRASADVDEGAENTKIFRALESPGAHQVDAARARKGVHEVAAVHGFLSEDVVDGKVHGAIFGRCNVLREEWLAIRC